MTTLQTAGEAARLADALDARREIGGHLWEAAAMLRSQAVEIEKLRKDAARYDWFADIAVSGDFERAEKAFNCFEFAESCTRQEIDAAIDAAIQKELTP